MAPIQPRSPEKVARRKVTTAAMAMNGYPSLWIGTTMRRMDSRMSVMGGLLTGPAADGEGGGRRNANGASSTDLPSTPLPSPAAAGQPGRGRIQTGAPSGKWIPSLAPGPNQGARRG